MRRSFCLEHPETFTLTTTIVDARPGRVALADTPFYAGGGGQLPDRGMLRWDGGDIAVTGFEYDNGVLWHLLADQVELPSDAVEARVDVAFRGLMRELHTSLHVVNALVYQRFNGALVTGVQMNDDATARIDFDLPEADSELLRALEPAINEAISQNLPVGDNYVPEAVALGEPGLIRSRSVAPPPTADGLIRIVEIAGLDRQACGGTHLASTGGSRPVRILKIDNKGRHNRRVRIGLSGGNG